MQEADPGTGQGVPGMGGGPHSHHGQAGVGSPTLSPQQTAQRGDVLFHLLLPQHHPRPPPQKPPSQRHCPHDPPSAPVAPPAPRFRESPAPGHSTPRFPSLRMDAPCLPGPGVQPEQAGPRSHQNQLRPEAPATCPHSQQRGIFAGQRKTPPAANMSRLEGSEAGVEVAGRSRVPPEGTVARPQSPAARPCLPTPLRKEGIWEGLRMRHRTLPQATRVKTSLFSPQNAFLVLKLKWSFLEKSNTHRVKTPIFLYRSTHSI